MDWNKLLTALILAGIVMTAVMVMSCAVFFVSFMALAVAEWVFWTVWAGIFIGLTRMMYDYESKNDES